VVVIRDQGGQMIVETILILALFLAVGTFVAGQFKQNELFAQMVSAPWRNLAGLLQNGVWRPPEAGMQDHPAMHRRHVSMEGDKTR
jgi:hypothetical protein